MSDALGRTYPVPPEAIDFKVPHEYVMYRVMALHPYVAGPHAYSGVTVDRGRAQRDLEEAEARGDFTEAWIESATWNREVQ